MTTCKTCRFWEPTPMTSGTNFRAALVCNPEDPDTFKPMAMPFEVRLCGFAANYRNERPPIIDGCAVLDASNYWAALITAENFGCVRHAPIEPPVDAPFTSRA